MNQVELYKNIFGSEFKSGENNSIIKDISKQFPYFGLAQFYNLKNVNSTDADFNLATAKSSLFFKNSFYINKLLSQENISSTDNEQKIEEVKISNVEIVEENNSIGLSSDAIPKNEVVENTNEETEIVEADFNEAEKLNLKEIKFEHKPEEITETEILFEPLHTSDYFASQGIKLSNIVQADDKLGLQLKSFTSWLKTMKKAHPEKLVTNNIVAEAEVQKQAEISNIEAEVFTEAMAEAYAVQGKNVKAIEVYRKLSLSFPEKSAFFADKIENLKK